MNSRTVSRIFLSELAYSAIVRETLTYPETETGGILLGYVSGNEYFVLASLDPGPKAIRLPSYFEYDQAYLSHLALQTSGGYSPPLLLLGLWHRHPGSFDTFSRTDDTTHAGFLRTCGRPIISGLINIDPRFRMTFYAVSGTTDASYSRAEVTLGLPLHSPQYRVRSGAELLASERSRFSRSLTKTETTPVIVPALEGEGDDSLWDILEIVQTTLADNQIGHQVSLKDERELEVVLFSDWNGAPTQLPRTIAIVGVAGDIRMRYGNLELSVTTQDIRLHLTRCLQISESSHA